MNEARSATQERIDQQQRIVASLVPGSEEHRLATRILLLLRDSLYLASEIDELLAAAEMLDKRSAG